MVELADLLQGELGVELVASGVDDLLGDDHPEVGEQAAAGVGGAVGADGAVVEEVAHGGVLALDSGSPPRLGQATLDVADELLGRGALAHGSPIMRVWVCQV